MNCDDYDYDLDNEYDDEDDYDESSYCIPAFFKRVVA